MIYEEALYINKFKLRVESFVTQETQLKFTFCFSIIFFFSEKNKDLIPELVNLNKDSSLPT